jgi:hypothetical protein
LEEEPLKLLLVVVGQVDETAAKAGRSETDEIVVKAGHWEIDKTVAPAGHLEGVLVH